MSNLLGFVRSFKKNMCNNHNNWRNRYRFMFPLNSVEVAQCIKEFLEAAEESYRIYRKLEQLPSKLC